MHASCTPDIWNLSGPEGLLNFSINHFKETHFSILREVKRVYFELWLGPNSKLLLPAICLFSHDHMLKCFVQPLSVVWLMAVCVISQQQNGVWEAYAHVVLFIIYSTVGQHTWMCSTSVDNVDCIYSAHSETIQFPKKHKIAALIQSNIRKTLLLDFIQQGFNYFM